MSCDGIPIIQEKIVGEQMDIIIRKAIDSDKSFFVDFAVKLSEFNRSKHDQRCKYDDYQLVVTAIQEKAEETFCNRDEETLILIVELNGKPVGYSLGRIYEEDKTADNGTGKTGLFDELFLGKSARGFGLGQRLIDETIKWFKEKGIKRVKLHAYSWNNSAKKLYERNGFSEYAVSYEKFI